MEHVQEPLAQQVAYYQMTLEEANNYALRMFNDDAWDKAYTPHIDRLQHESSSDSEVKAILPVTLNVERAYICDDDAEEYANRPDLLEEDSDAQDDSGIITFELEMHCYIPTSFELKADMSSEDLIDALSIEVGKISYAAMYDDTLELSANATAHLIERITKTYMVIDTFYQHPELFKTILKQ